MNLFLPRSMKYLIIKLILIFIFSIHQLNAQKIYTEDISNFWKAYDKIQNEESFEEQLKIINEDYIKISSPGVKELCKIGKYTDTAYVKSMTMYPKFWNSLRLKTVSLSEDKININEYIQKLKNLYPNLQPANLYFSIGLGNVGGRPMGKDLVIGLELALGDSTINTSEFHSQSKKDFYKYAQTGGLVHVAIHEYIHTQQKTSFNNNYVLKQAIREGSCDFLSELVLNKKLNLNYIQYGYTNYDKTFEQFKIDLVNPNLNRWFYNDNRETIKDLGYFIGYEICKKYYENNIDKFKAISEIIDLDYDDENEIFNFLNKSRIFKDSSYYDQEVKIFSDNSPTIEKIIPINENNKINSNTKKIGIVFSDKMKESYSISFSDKGKSFFPLSKIIGFSEDRKTLWLELEIEKDREYEFVITNRGFISEKGFPLREKKHIITFTTE